MLEVKNLIVRTKNNILLNDICFNLEKGENLGIIGKVGDGKSILCKSLINLFDENVYLENGSVTLDNEPLSSLRGKRVSFVFQNPKTYLTPLKKVGKQIEEMYTYHLKDSKKLAKEKTLLLLEKIGFEDPLKIYDSFPHKLSGGMQQKVCLCIALALDVSILIMDESTSYLEDNSKEEILAFIKNLQKERNFSVIFVSHDFKEIYNLCNKIAVLRKGSMIEFGNKDDIVLSASHPYTNELLCDYYRYYTDIESFSCPLMNIELKKAAPFIMLSQDHYVRNWYLDSNSIKVKLPENIKNIRRKIYENLNNY